jgi:hypothetical protein
MAGSVNGSPGPGDARRPQRWSSAEVATALIAVPSHCAMNAEASSPHLEEGPRVGQLLRQGLTPGASVERYGLLLGAIVLAFAIQGIAHPAVWEQVVVTCLLGFTLLLALWVGKVRAPVRAVAVGIVLAVILLSVIEAASGKIDDSSTRIANGLLVALAPPAIILGVVRNLRATGAVTFQTVFGVLCVYLLLGMLFASIYGALDQLGETSFFAQDVPATVSHCLYFSFTTLTTVGYGDLTAATNLGHTLSVSEALLGQIYLVTIVSLIVANLGRRRTPGG